MTTPLDETKAKITATEQVAIQRSQETLGQPNAFHTAAEKDVLASRALLAEIQRFADAAAGTLGSIPARSRTLVVEPSAPTSPVLANNQPTKQGIPVDAKLMQQDGRTYYLGPDGQVISNIQ